MKFICNDKTVKNKTVQGFKDFNSQFLATQVKEGEQLISMMTAITKTSDLMGNDIVELCTENENLKNKICSYDEKMFRIF